MTLHSVYEIFTVLSCAVIGHGYRWSFLTIVQTGLPFKTEADFVLVFPFLQDPPLSSVMFYFICQVGHIKGVEYIWPLDNFQLLRNTVQYNRTEP